VSNAPSYAAVVTPHLGENNLNLLNTRVYLDVHPFLLGMSIASLFAVRLGWTQLGSGH